MTRLHASYTSSPNPSRGDSNRGGMGTSPRRTHIFPPRIKRLPTKYPLACIEKWASTVRTRLFILVLTGFAAATVRAEPAKHWAYVKLVRPDVPTAKQAGWVRNPIDAFVLARLEREGLAPSAEADGATLIRRLSL